jgi:molecular chaperone GrpE (heat shock protein)
MKSRVLDKSHIQQLQEEYDKRLAEEVDKAQTNAIKLCMVTFMQSLDDVGLAESTIDKIYRKEQSYVNSIRKGNVTWQEIAENLETEKGLTFNWIGED